MTFRVRSAGGAGYVTTNELVKLVLMDIDQFGPDLIVFLDGYNDLYSVYSFGSFPGVDKFANGLIARARWPVAYALYKQFSGSLHSVARVAESVLLLDMRNRMDTSATPRMVAETTVKNYNRARIFAEGLGAEFLVAIQPFAILHQNPGKDPDKKGPVFWEQDLRKTYLETLDAVSRGLQDKGIRVLDYTSRFDRPGGPGVGVF